jgi:hypothetical protein
MLVNFNEEVNMLASCEEGRLFPDFGIVVIEFVAVVLGSSQR